MDDYPIGIGKQGEIICLPKFNDCPSIAVYGTKRTGKTILCHRILEHFHWWLKFGILIGNDYQNEVYGWAGPCKSNEFYKKFITFKEKPAPLPIFLIFPNTNKKIEMIKLITPKIIMNLPIEYLVKHIEDFVELERTKNYFKNMNFDGCKSEEDVKQRINEEFEKQKVTKKAVIAMQPKINNMLKLFFEDGML